MATTWLGRDHWGSLIARDGPALLGAGPASLQTVSAADPGGAAEQFLELLIARGEAAESQTVDVLPTAGRRRQWWRVTVEAAWYEDGGGQCEVEIAARGARPLGRGVDD